MTTLIIICAILCLLGIIFSTIDLKDGGREGNLAKVVASIFMITICSIGFIGSMIKLTNT